MRGWRTTTRVAIRSEVQTQGEGEGGLDRDRRIYTYLPTSGADSWISENRRVPLAEIFVLALASMVWPALVAVVVLLLSCGGWVEQLAGSAVVTGDDRHAMVRATLAAVNRRLEALLS